MVKTRIGRKRLHTISDAASTSTTNFPDTSYSSASTRHDGNASKGDGRTSTGSGSVSRVSDRTHKSRRIADSTGVDEKPSPSNPNNCHALTRLKLKLHALTDSQPSENNERITHWLDQCQKVVPNKWHRQPSDDGIHRKHPHHSAVVRSEVVDCRFISR